MKTYAELCGNAESRWIKSRRGNTLIGKTFLTAVYCVVRCVLYPGTKICIAAGNRSQSINILEYIRDELMPNSPELRAEIKDGPITTAANAYVTFHNGSRIKVVTASDSSRGNRCNILVCDEFRMINENVITTVLRKFLTSRRHPKYVDKPEYQNMWERNKELYLSSAWFKEHWSYQVVLLIHKLMCQYDCAALFIEDIQMQTNVQGFKRLAQLQGAILYYCAEHEILVSAVTPSQWQNYCKARGRTSKEVKSGILSLEDSGKKRSKMLSLQYVRDTYGVETTNDNVSDAICIGTYVVNNIKIRTKR